MIEFYARIRVKKTRIKGKEYTYYYIIIPTVLNDKVKAGERVQVVIKKA